MGEELHLKKMDAETKLKAISVDGWDCNKTEENWLHSRIQQF
jgi:hypothetical protein